MKKKILFAVVFILLLYPLSNGSSEEKKYYVVDGYEWASMNVSEKLGFVKGWLEAGEATFQAILGLQGLFVVDAAGVERIKNVDQFMECWKMQCWTGIAWKGLEAKGLNLESLTLGQISDTITKIYSDPRVKKWRISKIMPIVYGRLNKGWTEREIDEVIAFYIKWDAFNEIKWGYYLKNILSMSKTESERILEEKYSLLENKPKVLKALEEYE